MTLSSSPRHAGDCLREPLMDWAVFIIDLPGSKCLHIHKSSAGSHSPSASGCTRVLGMDGRAGALLLYTLSILGREFRADQDLPLWPVGQCDCRTWVLGTAG